MNSVPNPFGPQTVAGDPSLVVTCPQCTSTLFMRVQALMVIPPKVVGGSAGLAESLNAVKCADCGQILPLSQLPEFTVSAMQKKIAEQEALNGQPKPDAPGTTPAESPAQEIQSQGDPYGEIPTTC